MEPFDIDKLIQKKLQEGTDLHQHEAKKAKPFVWAAIQNQVNRKKSPTWFHLAAAVIILFLLFSFVLFQVQNNHQKELHVIAEKMDQLESTYQSQASLLNAKNSQVDQLEAELKNVQSQFAGLAADGTSSHKETFVYRTDTVYIKQVEYQTVYSEPKDQEETMPAPLKETPLVAVSVPQQQNDRSDVIFPGNPELNNEKKPESIEFKFSSFASRRN